MSEKYKAAVGISYKSGGKWKVAAAGDLIEIDAEQAKGALARGAIEAAAAKAPPHKEKEV